MDFGLSAVLCVLRIISIQVRIYVRQENAAGKHNYLLIVGRTNTTTEFSCLNEIRCPTFINTGC